MPLLAMSFAQSPCLLRALVLWSALASAPAWAGAPSWPAVEEQSGPRAQGMGNAHTGVGTANETLLLNPAGMAFDRRYSIAGQYGFNPASRLHEGTLTVLDSKTAALATALRFGRAKGDGEGLQPSLSRGMGGLAWSFADLLAIGANVRRLWGELNQDGERQRLSVWTVGAGAMLQVGKMLRVGGSWENLHGWPNARGALLPSVWAAGASLSLSRAVLAADLRWNRSAVGPARQPAVLVGGELMVGPLACLRAGYRILPPAGGRLQVWSGGLGLNAQRMKVHASLERHFGLRSSWGLMGGLEFLL